MTVTLAELITTYVRPETEIECDRYGEGSKLYRGSCYVGHGKFGGDSFDVHDNLPGGFEFVDEWQDGRYRVVWIHNSLWSIVTYCEGDVTISTHETYRTYFDEVTDTAKCYGHMPITWSSYQSFRRCRVDDVSTVAEFLARYYKRDRYTGRGEEYAAVLLASHTESYEKNGYDIISHNDSTTGEVVAFYGGNDK